MTRRKRYRSILHTKNFVIISTLGFFAMLILTGLLPGDYEAASYNSPRQLDLLMVCQNASQVKVFLSWPQYLGYTGRYEVSFRSSGDESWQHLLATDATSATLEKLAPGQKFDFRVSFLGQENETTWAYSLGTVSPVCR